MSDPYKIRRTPKFTFSIREFHNTEKVKDREYALEMFHDECIILASGVEGTRYSKEVANEVAQYACWYYKLAKRKHTLWTERDQFSKGMFRSVNLSILKEKKRKHIEEGFCATLSVLWFGTDSYTVFHIGASRIILIREDNITQLTTTNRDMVTGSLTTWLGEEKAPLPAFTHGKVKKGDIFLFFNEGAAEWLSDTDILSTLQHASSTEGKLKKLLDQASYYGSTLQKMMVYVRVD